MCLHVFFHASLSGFEVLEHSLIGGDRVLCVSEVGSHPFPSEGLSRYERFVINPFITDSLQVLFKVVNLYRSYIKEL